MLYPIELTKKRINNAKLSSILSKSFGLCMSALFSLFLLRVIVMAAIKNKVVADDYQRINP